MRQSNLGWLFYRNYFWGYHYPTDKRGRENAAAFFQEKNDKLYAYSLSDYKRTTEYSRIAELPEFHSFQLTTAYPGLLIGTGYSHDIAAVGATKIGFYFDYTTGLPIYPGSSVKGILRSVFPGQDLSRIREGSRNSEALNKLAEGKSKYIKKILLDIGLSKETINEDGFVADLEEELFNGHVPKTVGGNREMIPLPLQQRFICHDAVITRTSGALMGPDFITPHVNRDDRIPDEVTEPNPIQLLKVMPGVSFQFTFQSSPSYTLPKGETRNASLTPGQTIELCKKILLDQGIGAKTNVGYGQLSENINTPKGASSKAASNDKRASQGERKLPPTEAAKRAKTNYYRGKLNYKKELLMEAEVIRSGTPNHVKVFIAEGNTPVSELLRYRSAIDVGTTVIVGVRIRRDLSIDKVAFRGFKK